MFHLKNITWLCLNIWISLEYHWYRRYSSFDGLGKKRLCFSNRSVHCFCVSSCSSFWSSLLSSLDCLIVHQVIWHFCEINNEALCSFYLAVMNKKSAVSRKHFTQKAWIYRIRFLVILGALDGLREGFAGYSFFCKFWCKVCKVWCFLHKLFWIFFL